MRPSVWLDALRLGATPPESPDEGRERIRLLRPLLDVQREQIEAYARKHKLTLVLDASAVGLSGSPVLLHQEDKMDITADILKLVGAEEEEE